MSEEFRSSGSQLIDLNEKKNGKIIGVQFEESRYRAPTIPFQFVFKQF